MFSIRNFTFHSRSPRHLIPKIVSLILSSVGFWELCQNNVRGCSFVTNCLPLHSIIVFRPCPPLPVTFTMRLCSPSQLAVKSISYSVNFGLSPVTQFGQWHVSGCDTSKGSKNTFGLALLHLTHLSSPWGKHVPASLLVWEMWRRPGSNLQLGATSIARVRPITCRHMSDDITAG